MFSVEITSNCLPCFVIHIYLFHQDGLMKVFAYKMVSQNFLEEFMTLANNDQFSGSSAQ